LEGFGMARFDVHTVIELDEDDEFALTRELAVLCRAIGEIAQEHGEVTLVTPVRLVSPTPHGR